MQKVIIDTNILVSSLLGKSYPYKIVFDLVFKGHVELFISPGILEEYRCVLSRKKFQRNAAFGEAALQLLESVVDVSTYIAPKIILDVLPDKSDNKFLELSIASQANFLITGNTKHFPFNQFENTKICSPKEYWENHRK